MQYFAYKRKKTEDGLDLLDSTDDEQTEFSAIKQSMCFDSNTIQNKQAQMWRGLNSSSAFKITRLERNNNNGGDKQTKYEARKRYINERVRQRQHRLKLETDLAYQELVRKGEAPVKKEYKTYPGEIWSRTEVVQLVKLIREHGKKWTLISEQIKSKTTSQCYAKGCRIREKLLRKNTDQELFEKLTKRRSTKPPHLLGHKSRPK